MLSGSIFSVEGKEVVSIGSPYLPSQWSENWTRGGMRQ